MPHDKMDAHYLCKYEYVGCIVIIMKSFGDLLKLVLLILISPLLLLAYIFQSIVAILFPVRFTKWFICNVPGASWQQGDLPPKDVQEDHKSAPSLQQLPKSGELVEYDFRVGGKPEQQQGGDNPERGQEIRIVSYNIFLAQNLTGVIEELSKMDPPPDVIFLQEDNIYELPAASTTSGSSKQEDNTNKKNESEQNTSFHHAGGAIAEALNMSCVFVNAHYRGGKESPNGLYGMTILSRFKLRNTKALKCETQPWIVDKMMTWLMGERHFPYAEIGQGKGTIALSSVHLPSVGKFSEKMQMLRNLFRQVEEASTETVTMATIDNNTQTRKIVPSIIGGDMNTMAFIYRYILPFGSNDLYFQCDSETTLFREFIDENDYVDPFSDDDGTYQVAGQGLKLDWVLLRKKCFEVTSFHVQQPNANTENKASDHQWVSVTCSLFSKLTKEWEELR